LVCMEHKEISEGENDGLDGPQPVPALSMQRGQNIFSSPFSTNNFGSIFSDDISTLHYNGTGPTHRLNNFSDTQPQRNENPNLWGSSLGNHFSSLSLDSNAPSQPDPFTSESNRDNMGFFEHNTAPLNPRSTYSNRSYSPWGSDTDVTVGNGNFYETQETTSPFSVLDYKGSSAPIGRPDPRVQSEFGVQNFSIDYHGSVPRPANPALYSPYGNPSSLSGGFNSAPSHPMPMNNHPTAIHDAPRTSPPQENFSPALSGFLGAQTEVHESSQPQNNDGIAPGSGFPANNGAQICRYFTNGNCMRGDRCNYLHVAAESNGFRKDDKKKDKNKRIFTGNGNQKPSSRARNGRGIVSVAETKKSAVDFSRYTSIDQVIGQVYRTCKDQHGCRFLQKKLEEKDQNPKAVEIIFDEVYDYMVELMTDPFGNYLCQKLIEHCSQQQQLLIVQKVAPHLVAISKNMHGTRAVQKMIECLCTPPQVQLVVNSLRSSVVPLIKDLNGNHVIQRCLHELSYQNKQFVYDAVADNCVEVATHRHGCCVMQRCIDSASEDQKLQLVRQISSNVLYLVQDQFGNYVVQYVLDLPFATVKVDLIREFLGSLSRLSTQKFSSNVIEKCLRVADEKVKVQLINELMESQSLMSLLQDAYGNYVVQTALSQAQPEQRANLEEKIRPLLPGLRNTNYGKRIQNKITLKDMDF